MKVFAIKALKIAKFASEETLCFEATVYFDGKRLGRASNEGHGGPNLYGFRLTDEVQAAALAYAKANIEWWDDSFSATSEVLDSVIGGLIDDLESAKLIKRHLKTKILFRLHGDPDDGSYRTVAHRGEPQKTAGAITEKYGKKVIELLA